VTPAAPRENARRSTNRQLANPSELEQRVEQRATLVVTVHRFRPAASDVTRFTRELTAYVREAALPGLVSARVAREYGSSRVAVVAEWDRLSTEVVSVAALYHDARLAEILKRSRETEFNAYVTTDAEGEPRSFATNVHDRIAKA
jgi:hypothetical protein